MSPVRYEDDRAITNPIDCRELEGVAGLNNARCELEVDRQLSILQVIFEVKIPRGPIHALRDLREREIVCRHQANGPALHQGVDH